MHRADFCELPSPMPHWDGCPASPCPTQLGLGAEQCWAWALGLVFNIQTQLPFRHGGPWDCVLQSSCGGTHLFQGISKSLSLRS